MEGKKSFLLYSEIIDLVEELTDEEAGNLFKVVLKYVNDLNPEIPQNKSVRLVFLQIKQDLKRDLDKWKDIKSKRVEAGRLGGIAKANNNKNNLPNLASASFDTNESSKEKQNVANLAVNDNVNVNVNVNDNVNVNIEEKKKTNSSFLKKENEQKVEKSTVKRFVKPTIEEIQAYCNQRNNGIDAVKFYNYYESVGWKIGKAPMKNWKACVHTWERKNKDDTPVEKNEVVEKVKSQIAIKNVKDDDYDYEYHLNTEVPKYLKRIFKGQLPSKYGTFECMHIYSCDSWLNEDTSRIDFIKSNSFTLDESIDFIEKRIDEDFEKIINATEGL